MPGPDLPEVPAPLKSIQHYLKIATEHDQRDPVVSYWARLYALQTGLKMSTKTTAENNFLLKLMDWLETTKKSMIDNEAITNDVAAQAHLENWALKLFLYADKNDREGTFNKSVIQSFYTAGLLYDVLTTFGELTEEAAQNGKYAKWKAAYIHNCLKNGETPVPGPMKGEGEEDEDNSNINLPGPEEDLLGDIAADSESADAVDGEDKSQAEEPDEPEIAPETEANDGEDKSQADELPPNQPDIDPETQANDGEDGSQADAEPSNDPEITPEPEVNDNEDKSQADEPPPNEPEAAPETEANDGADESQADAASSDDPTPESAEETPSEPGVDPAEEAPSEPEVNPESAEDDKEAPGMSQPTPPPNTDAFGFPSVPTGSNTSMGNNSSQTPGITPYPTLPSSITPNPYNPAPTPTSPSVPTNVPAATPKATGAALNPEQMIKAGKYIKWAGSAINYDDVPTAIDNLQKALHLLTTGEDS